MVTVIMVAPSCLSMLADNALAKTGAVEHWASARWQVLVCGIGQGVGCIVDGASAMSLRVPQERSKCGRGTSRTYRCD